MSPGRRVAASACLVLASFLALHGAAQAKKVLRVGVTAPPVSLDPRESLDSVSGLVDAQIYETPYFVAAAFSNATYELQKSVL